MCEADYSLIRRVTIFHLKQTITRSASPNLKQRKLYSWNALLSSLPVYFLALYIDLFRRSIPYKLWHILPSNNFQYTQIKIWINWNVYHIWVGYFRFFFSIFQKVVKVSRESWQPRSVGLGFSELKKKKKKASFIGAVASHRCSILALWCEFDKHTLSFKRSDQQE